MNNSISDTVEVAPNRKKTGDRFNNPYPDSFGYLRIGTPVNVDIGRPNVYASALDMEMLEAAGLLLVDSNKTSEKNIQGGGFDQKAQAAWGTSGAVSGGYQGSFLDITAEFHWAVQENISNGSAAQYILAWSKQKAGITLVGNPNQTQIYQCGTNGFREAIDAIISAVSEATIDPGKVLRAVNEFYRVYGTGFISKLELGAIGVFEGSAQYSSSSVEDRLDLGGSLSVSGFKGGANAAVEFAKKNIAQNATGNFEAHSFGVPVGSASEQWADGYMNAFAGTQLQKLADLNAWSAAFNMNIPAPTPPNLKPKPPNPEPIPTIPAGRVEDIEGAIRKMQLDVFADDYKRNNGHDPSPNDYSNYLDELRGVSLATMNQINLGILPPVNAKVNSRGSRVHPGYFQPPAGISGQIDFGGYAVTGFDYKPWSEVLPFLKSIEEAITGSQVCLGLALVWLSIRRTMGQYLKYCSRYEVLVPEGTDIAANAYVLSIQKMSEQIVTELRDPQSDWWDPSLVLQKLESEFQDILVRNGFDFFPYYELIKNNYEWLKRVPFGAVPVVPYGNALYYQPYGPKLQEKIETAPQSPSIGQLVVSKDALRFYPIISKDKNGDPFFAWMGTYRRDGSEVITAGTLTYFPGERYGYERFKTYVSLGMAYSYWDGEWEITANIIKDWSDRVHIVPKEPYNEPSWELQNTKSGKPPDCLVVYAPGDDPTRQMCLSGVNLDISFDRKVEQEHSPIWLVPIDYDVMRPFAETKFEHGGMPMWFEPMTEQLLDKLHNLGEKL
ncbi:hypothetical protein [Methylomusa anaerophila]|uniref:hypothetical protein n=1 Tax=Methylomusa anaerophila TaxID=1930071 RepID=UPI002D1FB79D|nr:hypothetical protein [Methylomusa anaerophila]